MSDELKFQEVKKLVDDLIILCVSFMSGRVKFSLKTLAVLNYDIVLSTIWERGRDHIEVLFGNVQQQGHAPVINFVFLTEATIRFRPPSVNFMLSIAFTIWSWSHNKNSCWIRELESRGMVNLCSRLCLDQFGFVHALSTKLPRGNRVNGGRVFSLLLFKKCGTTCLCVIICHTFNERFM